MASGKTDDQIIQTSKNLCNTMGIDFNEAVQTFQSIGGGNLFGNQRR